jgi:hypothetical protein
VKQDIRYIAQEAQKLVVDARRVADHSAWIEGMTQDLAEQMEKADAAGFVPEVKPDDAFDADAAQEPPHSLDADIQTVLRGLERSGYWYEMVSFKRIVNELGHDFGRHVIDGIGC